MNAFFKWLLVFLGIFFVTGCGGVSATQTPTQVPTTIPGVHPAFLQPNIIKNEWTCTTIEITNLARADANKVSTVLDILTVHAVLGEGDTLMDIEEGWQVSVKVGDVEDVIDNWLFGTHDGVIYQPDTQICWGLFPSE